MKRYTNNKDFNTLINILKRNGWACQNRKKHNVVISPFGKKVFFSKTPSDYRALNNFKRDIFHIANGVLNNAY